VFKAAIPLGVYNKLYIFNDYISHVINLLIFNSSSDTISYILNGKKVGTLIGGIIGAKIAMKVDEEKLR